MATILAVMRYAHPAFGGGDLCNQEWFAELVRRGHRVVWLYHLFRPHPNGGVDGVEYRHHERITWEVVEATLRELQPDVAIVQNQPMEWVRAAREVVPGIRAAVLVHYWSDVHKQPAEVHRLWQPQEANCRRIAGADLVVANSYYTAHMLRALGIPGAVVAEPCFGDIAATTHRRERYIIIGWKKHMRHVLAGLPRMFTGRTWELYPYDGPLDGSLRLPAHVRVMPWAPSQEIFEGARVLVHPTYLTESFSRVAVEAIANGVPVLHSGRGNLAGLIGDAGVLVPADAPLSWWAAGLRQIETDYDGYVQRARQRQRLAVPHEPAATFCDHLEALL